jgi:calcium permeable stress-gated cation channel
MIQQVRFFEMMMKVFAVFTFVTWPILLPINVAGMQTQSDGLGRLGFGNINRDQQSRYWAHLIIAYGLTGFTIWLMRKELLTFTSLRQQFLLDKNHSHLAQARTVLITAVPSELAEEHKLRELFSFVPGGINKIWIYRNVEQLPQTYDERIQLCEQLESAATTLLTTAIKARSKLEEKQEKAKRRAGKGKEDGESKGKHKAFPLAAHVTLDDQAFASDMEKLGAEKLLASIHRPKHRIKTQTGIRQFFSLPTWLGGGQQVDTIDYCTENIARCNQTIKELREKLPEAKHFGSCFIQCELQIGAHVLAQCLSYHEPFFMSDRWIEAAPEDIVWGAY